jgi:hypothetical protein
MLWQKVWLSWRLFESVLSGAVRDLAEVGNRLGPVGRSAAYRMRVFCKRTEKELIVLAISAAWNPRE